MRISIVVCLLSFASLIWMLRQVRVSLGLPVAYLANLLLLHVPGAVAHVFDTQGVLTDPLLTRTGIILTAIGSVAFVAGVAFGHFRQPEPVPRPALRGLFWKFCVIGGGFCSILSYLIRIPSIGAVLERGGPIWMLGVLLALRASFVRRDLWMAVRWMVILAIYPTLILLLSGFLSYGSAATIIVVSGLAVTARRGWSVAVASVVLLLVGTGVFLGYYQNRPQIRAAVWGGADTNVRIDASMAAVKDIKLFDPRNPVHLIAFDERLNQNYFIGLAASRLDAGQVGYLHGRSLVEGVQAMIPRALWPDKPVVAGSPKVVSEMTGLKLDPNTSFGVGNVMEFYINFGVIGVIGGFLLLGFAIGRLDRKAAASDLVGNLGQTFLFFLVAVALIQPNGSMVELMSGSAAAVAAAFGWRWAWERWPKPVVRRSRVIVTSMPQAL